MTRSTRTAFGALALTATIAIGGVSAATPALAAELPTPVVHYSFDSAPANGTTVLNEAGSDNNATIAGTGASFSNGALVLPGGSASSGAAFVSIPSAPFLGQHKLTVSTWLKNSTGNGNYAAAYVGNTSTSKGYWLLNPANPAGYVKSVLTTATASAPNSAPWGTEVGPGATNAATSGRTATSDLALYTSVIDGDADTLSVYVNGALVSTTPVTADISNYNSTASDLVAYLGKSSYSDTFFKGRIDDYAVYNSALTAAQVGDLYNSSVLERAANGLTVQSSAEESFSVPVTLSGAAISWTSTSAAIAVDNTTGVATVTRPVDADATVTLTAHIVAGSQSTDRSFTVSVPRGLTLAERVQQDLDAITIANSDDIRTNFTIPSLGALGSTISWTVKEPGVASPAIVAGVSPTTKTVTIARPAAGTDATRVVLTATVTNGDESRSKDYTVTVSPIESDGAATEAYVWAYFTGEGAGAERVSLAASKGNDALAWNTLNDGNPLFSSTLGTMGLRDPFILRSHDGDKFFMLATDLKVDGLAGGFSTAQISGSKYIEIYESTDLVNWTPQRHAKVSTDYAGNTWAPEAYWDDALGKYVVYWASNLYPTTDAGSRTAVTYNRMMYVTTDDFSSFSEPKIWIDVKRGTGKGTIDATVAEEDGTYYRFYKDEANNSIREEKSTDLLATVESTLPGTGNAADKWSLVKSGVAAGLPNGEGSNTFSAGEGPNIFAANENDVNDRDWFLFIDQPDYHGGPNHYIGFANDDLDNPNGFVSVASKLTANLPQNSDGGKPRHGTVIPVTRSQYQAVLEGYAPDLAVVSIAALTATTDAGVTPVLPANAILTKKDGSTETASVTWDAVSPAKYATPGTTFTVKGIAQDASRAPVESLVTVAKATFATATPTISGTAKVGSTLTVNPGSWGTTAATFTYQWLRNGSPVTNATASSYVLKSNDRSTTTTVRVTATAEGYTTASVTSAATAKVAAGTITGVTPKVSGTAKVGKKLSAKVGTWKPSGVTKSYRWYRSGKSIGGATSSTYTLKSADSGKRLTVKVTGKKTGYTSVTKASRSTATVKR